MIWPGLWVCVLAVVLCRIRALRAAYRLTSRASQDRAVRQHGMIWSHARSRTMVCGCTACVSEFDHFQQWVQIA